MRPLTNNKARQWRPYTFLRACSSLNIYQSKLGKNKIRLSDVFWPWGVCKQSFSSETTELAGVFYCLFVLLFIFINLQGFFGFDFLIINLGGGCHRMHMEVRGQLLGVDALSPTFVWVPGMPLRSSGCTGEVSPSEPSLSYQSGPVNSAFDWTVKQKTVFFPSPASEDQHFIQSTLKDLPKAIILGKLPGNMLCV